LPPHAATQLTCIAATVNGTIGMLAHGIMSGILGATILMLHLLLLTSIFVNFKTMRWQWLGQLRFLSFFQYGFDALVSNEMAGRRLTDLPVESGSAVLAQLGFEPGRIDLNLLVLFAYLGVALLVSYTVLARCVKEKR
jgi:ABC-type multidrug transport system permease subunit